jgi:hypothetical protein
MFQCDGKRRSRAGGEGKDEDNEKDVRNAVECGGWHGCILAVNESWRAVRLYCVCVRNEYKLTQVEEERT